MAVAYVAGVCNHFSCHYWHTATHATFYQREELRMDTDNWVMHFFYTKSEHGLRTFVRVRSLRSTLSGHTLALLYTTQRPTKELQSSLRCSGKAGDTTAKIGTGLECLSLQAPTLHSFKNDGTTTTMLGWNKLQPGYRCGERMTNWRTGKMVTVRVDLCFETMWITERKKRWRSKAAVAGARLPTTGTPRVPFRSAQLIEPAAILSLERSLWYNAFKIREEVGYWKHMSKAHLLTNYCKWQVEPERV